MGIFRTRRREHIMDEQQKRITERTLREHNARLKKVQKVLDSAGGDLAKEIERLERALEAS